MAIVPAGYFVKGPETCNGPPPYSLLSSVTPQTINDPHWQAGPIEFESFLCGEGLQAFIDLCPSGIIPPSGVSPADFVKPSERNTQFCSADPFIVVGSYNCPPVGRPAGEAFEIARKRLLVWESKQVEESLWTGTSANGPINPSFAFGNPDCDIFPIDINPAGALDPVAAIAILEEALGDIVACGGVIHVPPGLIPYLDRFNLISDIDGKFYTALGNLVIAGYGYPGTGPANIPNVPGEVWIFGTGPLILVRGNLMMVPDQVQESIDRTINNVEVRAERFYSVGFSCVVLALRVRICDFACV